MKIAYPEIDHAFELRFDKVQTIIIENPKLLTDFITDISRQIDGLDGRSVLSEDNKEIPINKWVELLTQFTPFKLNTKSLISSIITKIEKTAVQAEWYADTMEILQKNEEFLQKLAYDTGVRLLYSKINIDSLLKSAGPELEEEYDSLGEMLIDYFQLVTDNIRAKLFITLNLRSFISDHEAELFMDTVIRHGFRLLMIESCEKTRLINEDRFVIDVDLCEIS